MKHSENISIQIKIRQFWRDWGRKTVVLGEMNKNPAILEGLGRKTVVLGEMNIKSGNFGGIWGERLLFWEK